MECCAFPSAFASSEPCKRALANPLTVVPTDAEVPRGRLCLAALPTMFLGVLRVVARILELGEGRERVEKEEVGRSRDALERDGRSVDMAGEGLWVL